MLIFLGDSQPLGYEIGGEINQSAEHIPQHVRDKIYYKWAIHHECRPDYAYPQLLSESLGQDYVNLAQGGSSHLRHLYNFQSYVKDHQVPKGSTVFLNSNAKLRGFFVDNFTGEDIDFMHTNFWSPDQLPGHQSLFTQFLNQPDNYVIPDFASRILPYFNYQSVNHISLLCKKLGLNFLYFPICPSEIVDPTETETYKYLDLPPEEIISTLPLPFGHFRNNIEWLQFHPSRAGHRLIADHLREVYLERNLGKDI